jgi:hypothetical protein
MLKQADYVQITRFKLTHVTSIKYYGIYFSPLYIILR